MAFPINTAQSKTVSIAFVSLKTSIFGIISAHNAVSLSKEASQRCSSSVRFYFQLVRALLSLCILVDVCSLAYFFFSTKFKKIFYYVFYIFHWLITIFCVAGGLHNFGNSPDCQQSYALIVAVLSFSLLYQINVLAAMIGDLLIVLKYLHFGSNLVWLLLWCAAQSNNCWRTTHMLIGFTHAILSGLNFVNILLSKCFQNFSYGSSWRTLTIFSLFMMLLCYLLILQGRAIPASCSSAKLFQKTYLEYGLVELVSPLLLLIFVQEELIRDDLVQQQQDFEKCPQLQDVGFFRPQ